MRMAANLDRYAQRTFDFYERLQQMSDPEAIRRATIHEMKEFGHEYLTIWSVPPPGSPLNGIMLNTRPESFVRHYVERNRVAQDPVVQHLRHCMRPYSWDDVRQSRQLSRSERMIMDEGRDFDMREGLTIPIITATGALSVVSPCGRDPDVSERGKSAVEMISVIAHQALKRALTVRSCQDYVPLSPREREVLRLIALGHSDGEIASMLNVSATTVLAHAENAKRKLGAAKRTLAVVLALQRGEIAI
jgi:LuxR family quorum sensing-dependent transcriptional regulator